MNGNEKTNQYDWCSYCAKKPVVCRGAIVDQYGKTWSVAACAPCHDHFSKHEKTSHGQCSPVTQAVLLA